MDWLIIGLAIFFILAAIGKVIEASDKDKKKQEHEDEVQLRKTRAEEAREFILASGDKEMIARLRLMEAGFDEQKNRAAAVQTPTKSGPSLLGTAGAVAGGMVVGNAVSGAIAASQLEDALAQVSADFEADLPDASTELASMSEDVSASDDVGDEDTDFDFEI